MFNLVMHKRLSISYNSLVLDRCGERLTVSNRSSVCRPIVKRILFGYFELESPISFYISLVLSGTPTLLICILGVLARKPIFLCSDRICICRFVDHISLKLRSVYPTQIGGYLFEVGRDL